jgi:Protein of unknown function (DUF2934)
MPRNRDHDGKSKTASAVDAAHYPDGDHQEDHLLPTHSEIAALAHQIWIEQGRPHHSAETDWLEAERRLMAKKHPSAKQPSTHQGVATPSGTVQR